MKRELEKAIQVHQDGEHHKANEMLVKLANEYPEDAQIQLGYKKAIAFYTDNLDEVWRYTCN